MVIISSAYCYLEWEGFQEVKLLCIHPHNKIQVHNQMVPKLSMKERLEKVHSSLHIAQVHNHANFGHFKLLNSRWFRIPSCCGVTIMGSQHDSLYMILHCKLENEDYWSSTTWLINGPTNILELLMGF